MTTETGAPSPSKSAALSQASSKDDVRATPMSPPLAEANGSAGDCAERARLLDRLFEAARKIGELSFLKLAVDRVEAIQLDCAERSTLESEAQEIADQLAKTRQPALIRQLAFYFSDANLRHDTFLRGVIESDVGGYVQSAMLLGFNRLKTMGCSQASEIAKAVEASPVAAALELAPTRDAVRRSGGLALPPAASAEVPSARDECTIRIEQFPRGDASVTPEAVSEMCSRFGEIANIWLVRAKGGLHTPADEQSEFLGVVEVEFKTAEAIAAAIAVDPKLEWCGTALRIRSLADFRNERSAARGVKRPASEEDEASSKRARIEEEAASSAARFERGLVFKLQEVPSGITWKEIKDAFNTFGDVVYVDHNPEASDEEPRDAHVRMRDADGVKAAVDKLTRPESGLVLELIPPEQPKKESWASLTSDEQQPLVESDVVVSAEPTTSTPAESPPLPSSAEEPGEGTMTDPYGGGDEAVTSSSSIAIANVPSETSPANVETAVAQVSSATSAKPETAVAEVSQVDGDADVDSLFVVDTEGSAGQEVAETAEDSSKKVLVKVILLQGDEEEAYIQKMALALAEKRAAKGFAGAKAGKGGKKGKESGKGKKDKGGKGKKDGKSGKKGSKRGKRDYSDCFSDDST